MSASTRRLAGPFNRVEGDLEIALDVGDGRVVRAEVNSPLYRGFEQILEGKLPADALVLVPRICGICSVAQSAAAAQALAHAAGLTPPDNGRLAANLTLAVENLADHLTHFYLFFMPDFARAEYAARPWHQPVAERFAALKGRAASEVLPARAQWMQAMGVLAGKWPHTLAVQPGGSTRPLTGSDLYRLRRLLAGFRRFVESTLLGARLEDFAALGSWSALAAWHAEPGGGDLRRFLDLADALELWHLGRANDRYLSYGAYDEVDARLFAPGLWQRGRLEPVSADAVREDLTHAWYASGPEAQDPGSGHTVPMPEKTGAYSWCKAPRLNGQACETGALARQVVAGQPLLVDVVGRHGGSVAARVLARMVEFARLLPAMERWLDEVRVDAPWCVPLSHAEDCAGVGLIEAARGSLGHWLAVRRGRIHGYQIVAPTTWNFSPRDAAGQPGALELALQGVAVAEASPIPSTVHHVVRSFDPCMACTVH